LATLKQSQLARRQVLQTGDSRDNPPSHRRGPYKDYPQIAGNTEVAKEMLRHNIFSHHISTRAVTFQSMPMQVFCKTMGFISASEVEKEKK